MKMTAVLFSCLLIAVSSSVWPAEKATSVRTLIWSDGTRYVGGVVNGKREGKGTIYWQDGTRFSGHFQNDKKNGPGTMVLPDGSVRNGYFKDDLLVPSSRLPASKETVESVESVEPLEPVEPASPLLTESEIEPATESKPDSSTLSKPQTHSSEPVIADKEKTEEAEDAPEKEKIRLKETLNQWAQAWSDQDADLYLGFYTAKHVPYGDLDWEGWTNLRRKRIERPDFIQVKLEIEQIELLESDLAEVSLKQKYTSNTFADMTEKIFQLKKVENDWKILSERSR